jgi:S-adenosylmethionine synthetase
MKKYFATESVTEGHPDKTVRPHFRRDPRLDIAADPTARVACEIVRDDGMVCVMGEITTSAWIDIEHTVRDAIRDTLRQGGYGFDQIPAPL